MAQTKRTNPVREGRCMVWCMQRTNIYLTEDQQRALDELARIARTNRSAVLRDILDAELFGSPDLDDETREAFGRLADGYSELVTGLFDDDPDLRIDA